MVIKHLWAGIALAAVYLSMAAVIITACLKLGDTIGFYAVLGATIPLGIAVTAMVLGQVGSNEIAESVRRPGARETATGRPQRPWSSPSVSEEGQ